MTDPVIFDPSFNIAGLALNGLSRRRDVISQNIANVDTPGYKAQQLSFESALQSAIKKESSISLATTNPGHIGLSGFGTNGFNTISPRPGGTTRADNNNVDIDSELTQLTETGLRYQALTNVVGKKFTLLKSILR